MGVHMKVVDILLNALKGIAANGTRCGACAMCRYTAQEALDKYYGKDREAGAFKRGS